MARSRSVFGTLQSRAVGAVAGRAAERVPVFGTMAASPLEVGMLLRYDAAAARAEALRTARPGASAAALSRAATHRSVLLLGATGAAAGGVASVPAVGTAAAAVVVAADLGVSLAAVAELVMTVGLLHGYDAESLEERRTWVLGVLAMALEVEADPADAAVLRAGGAASARALGAEARTRVNAVIAARLASRLGVRAGMLQFGRLLPFGIGAVVGGAGNATFVRRVGEAATEFFGPAPVASAGRGRGRRRPAEGPGSHRTEVVEGSVLASRDVPAAR